MNILLTGATGFIGSAVAKALKNSSEHSVTALSSRNIDGIQTVLHNGYNFDKKFLASQGCEGLNALVHLGAFIPKSSATADDLGMSFSNIANTKTLLESELPNLRRIVYISTIDVYTSNDVITEATVPNPVSLYGQSKLYCERMAQCHAKQKGISCAVLRLGHVFGPGEEAYKKVIPNAIRSILAGEPVRIYNGGKDRRSFIYIDDVVKAIVNAVDYTGDAPVINVTGNEPRSISEIIDFLEIASGKKAPREYIETGVPSRDVIFDSALLKQELLSEFTPVPEGLKKEYDYMAGRK